MLELGQSAELTRHLHRPHAGTTWPRRHVLRLQHQQSGPAAFRQGYLRYYVKRDTDTLSLGRFEFIDGQEITLKNNALFWLQTNRIAQRLVGNLAFSNGQRSFDGAEAKLNGKDWDLTAMAGRTTQGGYNMNANPELNVDIQCVAR